MPDLKLEKDAPDAPGMTEAHRKRQVAKAPSSDTHIAFSKISGECELLLAELQARNLRLQKLLQRVTQDEESLPAARVRGRMRARCGNAHIRQTR